MTKAMEYLHQLQEQEPRLFPEPLKRSMLTEADLQEIERGIGYGLPEPYREFLQSYQLPEQLSVCVNFCGDLSACYEESYSREEDAYVALSSDDLVVTRRLVWQNIPESCGSDFVRRLKEEQASTCREEPVFLEAGFIQVGELDGYLLFLDLISGEVVEIYHEEVWEMSLVEGVDPTSTDEIRDYLDGRTICLNFEDFLRWTCTGDILNEDDGSFPTMEELVSDEIQWILDNPALYNDTIFERPRKSYVKGFRYTRDALHMDREEAISFMAELLEISVQDCAKAYEKIMR